MLLEKLTNALRGEVRLRIESGFPERILNLCGARKLAFWDVVWLSPIAFTCSMTRRDWAVLRQAVRKLDCTAAVVDRSGVPYFLRRFRRRYVLLTCGAFCAAALFFGSFFIWNFRIEGNVTVTDEEILRALEKNGVGLGTFGLAVDGEDLRNHVLLDLPQLGWIAVNVSGCQAQVQVRERIPAPEPADKRVPCNLAARRAGLVKEVNLLGGVKMVLPGTMVEKGQILISGMEDTETYGARMMAGMGTVTARTWYTLSTTMPLTVEKKQVSDREKTRWALVFGRHRVKFYGNSNTGVENCDKIRTRTQGTLFGLPLPVTVEREVWQTYEIQQVKRTPEAAQKAGEQILLEYLHRQVDAYGSVCSTLCTAKPEGERIKVTLTAECLEQIGEPVPILTEEQAE